jgi:pimeloyl-ACP methyl ester carboxylesterase
VGIDQRGCGRSHPLATDALGELHRNTTLSLIEAVRTHLGIETWLVSGVSWGDDAGAGLCLGSSGQGLGAGIGRGNDDQP